MKTNGKPKQPRIEGLRLWDVEITFKNHFGGMLHKTLLITTRTESVKQVIQKAETVIRKNRDEWPAGRVSGVVRKGQLDA